MIETIKYELMTSLTNGKLTNEEYNQALTRLVAIGNELIDTYKKLKVLNDPNNEIEINPSYTKPLQVTIEDEVDEFLDEVTSQELYCDDDNDIHYSVYDLSECPEDATICRALFNAEEYVGALQKGIELGRKGYTNIVIKYKGEE